MSHLGKNILLIRSLTTQSQAAFGKRFDATKAMIISYEKGKAVPDELFISRLAKMAKTTAQDLKNKSLSEDDVKVEKIEKVKNRTLKAANAPNSALNQELPYKGGITLNDHIEEIKGMNEYLKGMLSFSLHDLSKNQKDIFAHLKGAVKRHAERYAKMNPEKAREELRIISTYADEIRMTDEQEGSSSHP